MNKLIKFTWMLALASFTLFTSCEKEELNVTEDVEFFVNSSVFDLEERGNCGQFGCYEFIFPISIQFPDSSISEVADYESLRATIKDWKEANPEAEARPVLAFPLEVMDEEGAIISVTSRAELVKLGRECRRDFFKRKRHQRGKHRGELCFRPSFPLTLDLADGSTITGEDAKDLKEQVRAWRAANPDSEERPTLAFPTDIKYKDGTVVSVASIEELKELKAACAEDEEG
jgi:hypothetical protein